MKSEEFIELAKSKFIYMDGATGSNLMKAGMPADVCPEGWIITHPEPFLKLQKAYVKSGSDIVLAPTFGLNRLKLKNYGMEDKVCEMNHILVALSRKAVEGSKTLVAGDLSMTGKQLKPYGNLDFEELVSVYKEQVVALCDAGVDLIVIETMTSLQEARAALLAVREVSPSIPVICSISYEENGLTMYGSSPEVVAVTLTSLGASCIGVNCSLGPKALSSIVRKLRTHTNLPIMAKPNAGLPHLNEQNETVYSLSPESFAEEMLDLCEAGATLLGGCCGTTPEHIEALYKKTKNLCIKPYEETASCFLASERSVLSLEEGKRFYLVGERINPTGKKALQAELREGKLNLVLNYASEQEENKADILDINMGLSDIDEDVMMQRVISEVNMQSALPLSIDSSSPSVIEHALRTYPGRALVNSVSLEKNKFENLLPIVAKYGAMFILLPLSDEGLPKSLKEKKEIIETIVQKALSLGMKREDIIVDALVNTVAARKTGALEALETIEYCKENGLKTICGLSNISFGLPNRSAVNAAFLTMAIEKGLTMAIANPNQRILTDAMMASDLLLNRSDADVRYIDYCNDMPEQKAETVSAPKKTPGTEVNFEGPSELEEIFRAVLKGKKESAEELSGQYARDEQTAQDVLNKALLPAISEVGKLFEKGVYFLPQLIASAEAMEKSIAILTKYLKNENQKPLGTVVIATVKGDIHDIGKNLVIMMLRNNGFEVIDLGKDVETETIVDKAIEHDADIIALSALMTTTMVRMPEVIAEAQKKSCRARIIVGGAVVTEEYAERIKADGYSKDAADCVTLCKKLLNL